ncbi:MAG: DsrE/DsrF/DrsH-like family protein, partial [Halobacteriales archaeon]
TGVPVQVFVTMNGLASFEQDRLDDGDLPVAGPVGEAMLSADGDDVPLFTEQLSQAKELGDLEVYACELAMDLVGASPDDYVDVFDDVLGVSGFLNRAADKQVIFV